MEQKKEWMVHVWGGAWNSDAYPSIETDYGIKEGYHYFDTEKEKDEFVEIINKPRRTNYSIPKGMVKQENTPNVQNNASQKAQTTKREIPRSTKTDLQKSQDWFFE